MPQTHSNNGAVPVSTPPLKPLGLMQMLAPLLAVLLAVVVALLAAWALSLPAPAQGVTAIQADRTCFMRWATAAFVPDASCLHTSGIDGARSLRCPACELNHVMHSPAVALAARRCRSRSPAGRWQAAPSSGSPRSD